MNPYEAYALLDAQLKELENQKDELRTKILKDMIEKGESKIETNLGNFSVTKLKSWKYTDKVSTLAEKLKEQKAKEESCGDATYTEKESLRFNQAKL
jgi:hypothetical protein